MQFIRLNSIALAVVAVSAAVLPRQETSTSPITSTPITSATKKSYLTSITTLPMPTSVDGDTAYPTSTTAVEVTTAALTSTFPTPSSQPPFTRNNNATATNATTSMTNVTTSSTSIFATGLSDSTGNATAGGMNSTGVILSTKAPYANSSTNGLVGGVAATGTAVIVTGLTAANATAAPSASSANSTRAAPVASTSMLVQLYLPSALAANKASKTEIPLGSNMSLVVDNGEDYEQSSSTSRAKATVALFSNSTTAAGVAQATGVTLSTASTSPKNNNASISAAPARATSTSTVHVSNTTMTTVTVKPNPTNNATLAAASNNATSSSSTPLSTAPSNSSQPIANGITTNGTMLAVTYDNKNGTIIQLVSASNSTNPLAATGTAASTASASAALDRRNILSPEQTAAPITPVAAKKGAWSKLAYARTEYLPRPGRFFGGEGWGVRV